MYIYIYVCMYVCLSVCLSVCLYVCMYVCMYVCICTSTTIRSSIATRVQSTNSTWLRVDFKDIRPWQRQIDKKISKPFPGHASRVSYRSRPLQGALLLNRRNL